MTRHWIALATLTAIVLAVCGASHAAEPGVQNVQADATDRQARPGWSYIEGRWFADGEVDTPTGKTDTGGFGFEASLAASDVVFFQAGYETSGIETPVTDIAYSRFRVGPGLTTNLTLGATVLAPWLRLDYRRDSLAGTIAEGYGAAAGLRWLVLPSVEIAVSGSYAQLEADVSSTPGEPDFNDTTLAASVRVRVLPGWWLTAGYRSSEIEDEDGAIVMAGDNVNFDRWLLGLRWQSAADPPALAADADANAVSGDPFNYVDFLYLFGDEVEFEAAGGHRTVDIERGAAFRGSAALTSWLVVAASATTLHLDTATSTDDFSFDWYSIGPGLRHDFHTPVGDFDVYGLASYERVSSFGSGQVFDGAGATLGLRYRVGRFELAPSARIFTAEADGAQDPEFEGGRYRLDLIYSLSPAVGLVLHAAWVDAELDAAGASTDVEQTVYGAGLRFYFGSGI
ncbi:MAG: hypothetical protein L0H83_12665 [Salinisphaera sp.]|nr:hypothetical protein [Salinisphaera sp.]